MELKMSKSEASAFIADALKTKCNIVGNVKVSSDIVVEVDFASLVSAQAKPVPVEEPKEEVKKEEVVADANAQEEQSADAITSFFTVQ
jgi:hypothetical protein